MCWNCRRHGVENDAVAWSEVSRKTRKMYCNFRRPPGQTPEFVYLCRLNCRKYMMSADSVSRDYWPAMMWKFLSSEPTDPIIISLDAITKWSYIPTEWRHWWIGSMQQLHGTHLTVSNPEPKFELATDDYDGIKKAITELKWRDLYKAIDRHVSYPSVRCPWGCSEFLHQCNFLPIEDFLAFKSNWCFEIGVKKKSWPLGTKPSYPDSCVVLDNPDFRVTPCVYLDENGNGLSLLCCRNHSVSATARYLHVPVNPLGSLYAPHCDQYAQTTLQSRTLRRTKKNTYSDTFQTNVLMGGYDGLDTCYLTKTMRTGLVNSVTLERQLLYISGRSDVRSYVCQLGEDPNSRLFLPRKQIDGLLQNSARQFPDIQLSFKDEIAGSTFVTLEDGVNLQEHAYADSVQTILVYRDSDDTDGHEQFHRPPWPKFLLRVHPADGYGEQPSQVPDKVDSEVYWCMVCVVSLVPQAWSAVAKSVKTSRDEIGYLMRLSWNTLRTKVVAAGSQTSRVFFSIANKGKSEIQQCLGIEGIDDNTYFGHFRKMFRSVHSIEVVPTDWDDADISPEREVIICTGCNGIPVANINIVRANWDLVLFAVTEPAPKIFCRHGGMLNRKWWMMMEGKEFQQVLGLPDGNVGTLKMLVYVRGCGAKFHNLKSRYMRLLGGQTSCYCRCHEQLLILNPSGKPSSQTGTRQKCVLPSSNDGVEQCSENANFICSMTSCPVGICHSHFNLLEESSDDDFYIFSNGHDQRSRGGNSIHSDDDSVDELISDDDEDTEEPNNDKSVGLQAGLFHHTEGDCDEVSILGVDEADVTAMGPTDSYDFPLNLLNDNILDDSEDDAVYDSNDEDEVQRERPNTEFQGLLTSVASRQPLSLEFPEGTDVPFAPLHVLLNQQGHLLVRKNAKLRLNRKHKHFCQGITANLHGRTLPLVFPEALLKPSIFYFDFPDGTIPGALPAALWADEHVLGRLGIASMRNHITTRIQNPSLLCSTDPQYHFLSSDISFNLGLRGNDSQICIHRGLAEKQKGQGASFRTSEGNGELRGELVEDHSNVHKLSALVAESPPDYFYTQSCNQSTCPGVKRLRAWITSVSALQRYTGQPHNLTESEASTMLRESAASYIHRTWSEVSNLWMKYIIHSDEEPLFAIEWAWYRKEFQDENGNTSHIHAILKTKVDTTTKEGLSMVLSKIRGSITDLLHEEEMVRLKNDGVVDSLDVFGSILEDAMKFLTHRCHARCQIPKLQPNGDTEFVCKAPSNWLLTTTPNIHSMLDVKIAYSKAARDILIDLGLAVDDGHFGCRPIHEGLMARRHVPKCSARDGKFSPTNPDLFVRMPSASNLQYTTGHTVAAYLTKYVASIDKVSVILIKPPVSGSTETLRADHRSLNNTKISSVRMYHESKKAKISRKGRNKNELCGRPITHMECLSALIREDLVVSTRDFKHVSTSAREYRAAMHISYRRKACENVQDLQALLAVTNQTVREELGFPPWRQFTPAQVKVISDELQAPLQTDSMTFFSMRPPELFFVRHLNLYVCWFRRYTKECSLLAPQIAIEQLKQQFLSKDIRACSWIDGFNHVLRIRGPALRLCVNYLKASPDVWFGDEREGSHNKKQILALLIRLESSYETYAMNNGRTSESTLTAWPDLRDRFIDGDMPKDLPVVWHTPIYPRRKTAFLVQLLLQKGSIRTEYELLRAGTLREAYIAGDLLDISDPRESARDLMRRYVLENLETYPGSIWQYCRNLGQAFDAINDLMLGTTTHIAACPAVLYSHMVKTTEEKVVAYIMEERKRLIESLWADLTRCDYGHILPCKETVLNCRRECSGIDTAVFFPPPIHDRQNLDSYNEQKRLMEVAERCYNDYVNPGAVHRNIVICGGPGVGKTTVCQFITLFLLSKGMNVVPTSLVADRSKQLGGTHFHRLLSLNGDNDSGSSSPGRQAEKAIRNMYRKPEILGFIQSLDAINLDELGVFPAESIAIFDMVLRYVRKSPEFMGGLMVYCTLDHLQLLPFRGTPALLSMYVVNEFNFWLLKESVRASYCPILREIGSLTRSFLWTEEVKNRLAQLLRENCRFVADFNDPGIPEDAVYVFGRKAPCREAEKHMLDKMRVLHCNNCIECLATDEESSTGGDWSPASQPTTKRLETKVRRSQLLLFHPKARFEFTDNDTNFSQGQLALLLTVPDGDTISKLRPIVVWKAPTGLKNFPPAAFITAEYLTLKGWKEIKVPYSTTRAQSVDRGIQGRRSQYPLKPRIATTIHACMGSTLSAIVTAVVSPPGSPYDYSLWEAAQLVVLLSRTEYAVFMTFVGDMETTIQHILEVLEKPHRFLGQIHSLLQFLFSETSVPGTQTSHSQPSVITESTIYRPCDAVVGDTACVYVLVSTRDTNYCYIGQTDNMGLRLSDHNSGNGASGTSHTILMPWAIGAYITGFQSKRKRESFEALWKVAGRNRGASSLQSFIHVATTLISQENSNMPPSQSKLRLITCGTITRQVIPSFP